MFIARDHHYNSESFNEIKEGDKFTARVIGQRFELNDKYISIIAELKVERKIERKSIGSKKAKGIVIKNDIVLSEDSESDEN